MCNIKKNFISETISEITIIVTYSFHKINEYKICENEGLCMSTRHEM